MTHKKALAALSAAALVTLLASSTATAASASSEGALSTSAHSITATLSNAERPPLAGATHTIGRLTQRISVYNGCDEDVWFKVIIKNRVDSNWIRVGLDGTRSYSWPRWQKLQRIKWSWRNCDPL